MMRPEVTCCQPGADSHGASHTPGCPGVRHSSVFSQRHYVRIAGVLRDFIATTSDPTQARDIAEADLIDALADLFESDNERFDRRRFRAACLPFTDVNGG